MDLLVLFYVADPVFAVAQPFGGVIPTDFLNQVVGVPAYLLREFYHIYAFENYVVRFHWVRTRKRRAVEDIE